MTESKSLTLNLDIPAARERIKDIISYTPLERHERLSDKYQCNVYLKREDQQPVRSYKLRGAYNKIVSLPADRIRNGVVCASAGNHAQGVAYTCRHLGIRASIFMPVNTPQQKIERVKKIGAEFVKIYLEGENYDDSAHAAQVYSAVNQVALIPPFDAEKIIEGQGTVGLEILEQLPDADHIFIPVGGGGLAAGIGFYFKTHRPQTILTGVEPAGAASMTAAFQWGEAIMLEKIDPFIDGAAVKQVGHLTLSICQDTLDQIHTVPEGKICATLLNLYNDDGIVCEPAGALSVAALDDFADEIRGKNVVCIISGGNNDSNRMDEIKKLADEWEGLQHYLVIRFPHNPDGLKTFFSDILTDGNHVNRIEYTRRDHGRSTYALIGIRSGTLNDYSTLTERLAEAGIEYKPVTKEDFLFKYWV